MSERAHRGRASNALAAVCTGVAALLLTGVLAGLVADLVQRGGARISLEFLTASPADAGRAGGIAPVILSTAAILVVCIAAATPLGIATAVFLSEIARAGDRFAAFVRRSLDALAAVPSIVFGLFGNALFTQVLGLGYSILAGGLTLACMVLPLLIRTVEQGLRAVPDDLRRAAAALALSRPTTIRRVLLPAAVPAVALGLVLGITRALAETAALLFTSGYATRTPTSLLDSGRALSVHVYDLAMNVPGGDDEAYASALILVALLVGIQQVSAAAWRIARGARRG